MISDAKHLLYFVQQLKACQLNLRFFVLNYEVIFQGVGAFEQLSDPGVGNLNKNFPKIQMPGGVARGRGGGKLKLRFDWYITNTIIIIVVVVTVIEP